MANRARHGHGPGACRFARIEPRRTAAAFVEGLLSTVERKTCWSLAERAGHPDPQPMQRLLRTAVWNADAVRDYTRDYLLEHLGHADGILIVDLCRHRDYAEVSAWRSCWSGVGW